ncbi:MAG TPA: DUF84 family protein [Thermoanaerobaculia bacterium]|nr:DUF84 family protein [Thermoanaerobaculia bacterium]
MQTRDFWPRLRTGIEVAVAGTDSERLLGVREGFLRYFHDGLRRPTPVAVVPQPVADPPVGLPLGDRATLELARAQALGLAEQLGGAYQFYVSCQAGLESLEVGDRQACFVRLWAVVLGPFGEAWGGSGSIQLPAGLADDLEGSGGLANVPGTRKQGGIISSLTGGLEGRRHAAAAATFHALSSLFYGVLQSRPAASRDRGGV